MKHNHTFSSILLIGLLLTLHSLPTVQAATDCAAVTEIPKAQCDTLVALYNSTGGAKWTNKGGWNVTNAPCSWEGIGCSGGKITSISLFSHNLKGALPNLNALNSLQSLWLHRNQLTGTIPDLSRLTSLEDLFLDHNQLIGGIPDLSKLTSLQWLGLSSNRLSGPIPSLNSLTKLTRLNLSDNPKLCRDANYETRTELKEFPVCSSFNCAAVTEIPKAQCDTLVALYDSTDGLNWLDKTGWNETNTPCSWKGIICSSGVVISIELSNNSLKGSLPDLSALTSLQHLELRGSRRSTFLSHSNELTGSIPDLSKLTNLQTLSLSYNQLTGNIPDLSKLTNLQTLSLSYNQLTGSIPDLSKLIHLQHLMLDRNQLTGSIPDLSKLTSLLSLALDRNELSGTIPDLSKLTSLQHLALGVNQLTGTIPDLSTLTSLGYLALNYNHLSGPIPSLSSLTQLTRLYLSDNPKLCREPNADYGYENRTEVEKFPICSSP